VTKKNTPLATKPQLNIIQLNYYN